MGHRSTVGWHAWQKLQVGFDDPKKESKPTNFGRKINFDCLSERFSNKSIDDSTKCICRCSLLALLTCRAFSCCQNGIMPKLKKTHFRIAKSELGVTLFAADSVRLRDSKAVRFFGFVKSEIFPWEEDGKACVKDVASPIRIQDCPCQLLVWPFGLCQLLLSRNMTLV